MSIETEDQARTWGMLCHLSALAMFTCIPFANIFGPLIVWLVKGKEFSFVQDQGKESVNFQITMVIIGLVLMILGYLIPFIGLLGFVLLFVNVLFVVIAGLQAKQGNAYRYPFAIRLIK